MISKISKFDLSGTFFNFNKVDLKKEDFMVEVVTPDQNQSKYVTANSPHKHVTFTFEATFKSDLETERTHGQLGAALLILILIGKNLFTLAQRFPAQTYQTFTLSRYS